MEEVVCGGEGGERDGGRDGEETGIPGEGDMRRYTQSWELE